MRSSQAANVMLSERKYISTKGLSGGNAEFLADEHERVDEVLQR